VPEYLEQRDDLEAPVVGQPHAHGQVRLDRELAGERVAERRQVLDVGMRADQPPEGRQQRRQQQARDAAVQPVRDAGVVALGEVEIDRGIHRRKHQAGQHLAVVVDDVGVLGRQVLHTAFGEQVADREPARAALTLLADMESRRLQVREELDDGPGLVPEDDEPSRVTGEVLVSAMEVRLRRAVE
jgi:hypothetical protein